MPVGELLARTTSAELTEWQAYEVAYGPVGPAYRDEALASLADLIEQTNYLLQAVNTDQKDRDRIPQAGPYPRPHQIADRADSGG